MLRGEGNPSYKNDSDNFGLLFFNMHFGVTQRAIFRADSEFATYLTWSIATINFETVPGKRKMKTFLRRLLILRMMPNFSAIIIINIKVYYYNN